MAARPAWLRVGQQQWPACGERCSVRNLLGSYDQQAAGIVHSLARSAPPGASAPSATRRRHRAEQQARPDGIQIKVSRGRIGAAELPHRASTGRAAAVLAGIRRPHRFDRGQCDAEISQSQCIGAHHVIVLHQFDLVPGYGSIPISMLGELEPFTSEPQNRFGGVIVVEKGGIADVLR
jgi:hypothetical protein